MSGIAKKVPLGIAMSDLSQIPQLSFCFKRVASGLFSGAYQLRPH
jgi:hypothetical protein